MVIFLRRLASGWAGGFGYWLEVGGLCEDVCACGYCECVSVPVREWGS